MQFVLGLIFEEDDDGLKNIINPEYDVGPGKSNRALNRAIEFHSRGRKPRLDPDSETGFFLDDGKGGHTHLEYRGTEVGVATFSVV